jgi:hypothetical protein
MSIRLRENDWEAAAAGISEVTFLDSAKREGT